MKRVVFREQQKLPPRTLNGLIKFKPGFTDVLPLHKILFKIFSTTVFMATSSIRYS